MEPDTKQAYMGSQNSMTSWSIYDPNSVKEDVFTISNDLPPFEFR
jgi:hypothetical protein